MTHDTVPAYGLWGLVVINTAVFVIFAFSFTKPATSRDWRSFGAFSAFIVALFTEMYGFPLTIYLLSGWISRTYPGVDPSRTMRDICGRRCLACMATLAGVCCIFSASPRFLAVSSCCRQRGRFSTARRAGTRWRRSAFMSMSDTRNMSALL